MNVNNFVEQIREQFVDAEDITMADDTRFRELDSWDSLTGMAILVMIKDEYGVDMPEADLRKCVTVRDIFDYIEANTIS